MTAASLAGRRLAVAVVGDLGRSPRVQHEALSLAGLGADVDLLGFEGSEVFEDVAEHPRIRIDRAPSPSAGLMTPWGQARSARALWRLLRASDRRSTRGLDLVLVQNPPALPTLPVASAWRRSCPWVIDWHNDSASLLALEGGLRARAARVLALVERRFGRRASGHLCVSRALAAGLRRRLGSGDVAVAYDRPARRYVASRARREESRSELATRLGFPDLIAGKRLLIVSATSYTRDEDLELVVSATRRATERKRRLELLLVVGGRGRGRAAFERRHRDLLETRPGDRLALRTGWYAPKDYPRLLAAADLAVCAHGSASGLDLPMKLADFRGAGLPSMALDYGACLLERFRPGVDGWLFSGCRDLSERFERLGSHEGLEELARCRRGLSGESPVVFEDGFVDEALPLLRTLLDGVPAEAGRSAA